MQVRERVDAGVRRAARTVDKRDVAFTQRGDRIVRDRRQQLAKPPHAAAIARIERRPAQARVRLNGMRLDAIDVEREREQVAAAGAGERVDDAGRCVAAAAAQRDRRAWRPRHAGGRVTAPSAADDTSAAYFAKTPLA